jgi:hypothetical protein
MSDESKKTVKRAQEFFETVQQVGEELVKVVPDKQLSEKMRRVTKEAGEVVKHIKERTDH